MAKPSYYKNRALLLDAYENDDPHWRRFRTGEHEQPLPDRLVHPDILKKLRQRVVRYRRKEAIENG